MAVGFAPSKAQREIDRASAIRTLRTLTGASHLDCVRAISEHPV